MLIVLDQKNLFPSLERLPDWFPGAGFKKWAASWAEKSKRVLWGNYELSKKKIVSRSSRYRF
jgi:hypothetical protein